MLCVDADDRVDARAVAKASLFVTGLAALWTVVAWGRPGTTFHLAPLFVAGLLPYAYVTVAKRRASARLVVFMAVAATAIALITTATLATAGKLEGPSLLPTGGAVLEAVVFSLAGGGFGLLAILSDRQAPDA